MRTIKLFPSALGTRFSGFDEMVGDDYPLLYNDRAELESWIEKFLNYGKPPMIDTKPIVDKLMLSNSLTNWTISKVIDEER